MISKTEAEGQALLIQLSNPFLNISKILSYSFEIAETDELYYYKEFRYSVDGFSYTDFIDLSQITYTEFNSKLPVFLNFRFTQVGEGVLEFDTDNMFLQTDQQNDFCIGNSVSCCDANSIVQGLVFNNCGCNDGFNPYSLGNTGVLYEQLCNTISNMFGFCVGYYRVDPDQKSRDVILKEYSLYNVVQYDTVKILIPDNQLPSRDIQYSPIMLDYPAQFEVHITRSSFEQVFGKGTRPMQHDYLYFEQYMNRMYEIDAVAQPDDVIFGSAYWRVSLVPYQKRTAVGFDNAENLKIQTDDIVSNIEDVFKDEREIEYQDTRKYNQYNTIGTQYDDYVRSYTDSHLKIQSHQIRNGYTVISKYYYDLSSVSSQEVAVKYRNGQAFTANEYGIITGAFTFFLNLETKSSPKTVLNFHSTSEDKTKIYAKYPKLDRMQQLKYNNIEVGDILSIERKKYIVISSEIKDENVEVTLSDPLVNNIKNFIAIKQPNSINLITYNDDFSIKLNNKQIIFDLFNEEFIPDFYFDNNKWYAFVINYNTIANQFSVFVYELENDKIKKAYKNTWSTSVLNESKNGEWVLFGNNCKFTNFRVWKSSIEEDEQISVLQQYVVNDTHLTTLVDNAAPELLMQKTK